MALPNVLCFALLPPPHAAAAPPAAQPPPHHTASSRSSGGERRDKPSRGTSVAPGSILGTLLKDDTESEISEGGAPTGPTKKAKVDSPVDLMLSEQTAQHLQQLLGSDHAPVLLELDLAELE